jgi:hypothetical protein
MQRSRLLAMVFAAVAWAGVLLQGYLTLHSALTNGGGITGGLIMLLGYFTILTNLLVCAALSAPAVAPASRSGAAFSKPDVVFGVATSILFVAISFHLLLRNVWHRQGLHAVANDLLHYVTPALYVLYWWLVTPKASLRWVHPVGWGLYPTLYLVYALIRGVLINSYPYSFIDAAAIGYPRTLINGVGLLIAYFAIGFVLLGLSRLQKQPPLVAREEYPFGDAASSGASG